MKTPIKGEILWANGFAPIPPNNGALAYFAPIRVAVSQAGPDSAVVYHVNAEGVMLPEGRLQHAFCSQLHETEYEAREAYDKLLRGHIEELSCEIVRNQKLMRALARKTKKEDVCST